MTGTEAPAIEYRPSSDLSLSFTPSEPPTTESTDSNGTVCPVEGITMSTLHGMLARILEQTGALWQAQASTNRILDELRQSIPAPRENAEFGERLGRIEALAGTLAHGQRADLRPGQGSGTTSNAYQDRSIPQSAPQTSFLRDIGDNCDASINPQLLPGAAMSTQGTTHHTDAILHASDERYPTFAPNVHIRNDEEEPTVIPPLGHIDQLTAGPVISPGQIQIGLPELQRGSVPATMPLPSTIGEDGNRPLGVLDHHVLSTSRAYAPSGSVNIGSEDSLHAHQEQLEAGLESSNSPPRARDEASAIDPIQSTSQDPTYKRVIDPSEVIQGEGGRMVHGIASSEGGLAHTRVELDNKRQVSFGAGNMPRVVAAERDEALHNQLAELADIVRQMLALYEEKKVLMEQQWTERLLWKEEYGGQMLELMAMASLLVDEAASARQREEEERQANEGNTRIHQLIDVIRKMDVEHRELLQTFSETWRTDNERRNEDIIDAVRATASEQVPFNVEGYLDEFSKALSAEVRILLSEVGKLREERRRIQYELGYLMTMQSTIGPDWPPEYSSPQAWPSPAGIPLPESPQPRAGWRAVSLRGNRHVPRSEPPPAPERQAQSWLTWQPNPAFVPTPPSVEPALLVPDRGSPGLFGPRTPPLDPSRGNNLAPRPEPPPPPARIRHVHSWATWQPNPALSPTPPPVEPTLSVQDRGSPGLFGPRSPSDFPHSLPGETEESGWRSWTADSWDTWGT